MSSLADALAEVRRAGERATELVRGSSQARTSGNVGLADQLIRQAQDETARAQQAAAVASTRDANQEAAVMVQQGYLGAIPWWLKLGGALALGYGAWRLVRRKGGRRGGR